MPQSIAFPSESSQFSEPRKLIHSEEDVVTFQSTVAYARITAFIHSLGDALPETTLTCPPPSSPVVSILLYILGVCRSWIERCPPHTGARRFGNLAFREWHACLERESETLVAPLLSGSTTRNAIVEVLPYFLGSFGSSQRLDYGTGHELSFFAFLCTLFQLDVLSVDSKPDAQRIGLLVFPAYVDLIQTLVVTYTLEPAGSHGVWGLDDHFAMSYLLGAAQLSHQEPEVIPTPASITNKKDVGEFRSQNLYFHAIGFINDVKKGPFWEHSPMLYDISGIPNWGKISSGMRKLYRAEVLGKFPVVQHFPFGDVFFPFTHVGEYKSSSKEAMTDAILELDQVQRQTQALHTSEFAADREALDADTPLPDEQPTKTAKVRAECLTQQVPTAAPWAKSSHSQQAPTAASWANKSNHSSFSNQSSTPRIPHTQRLDLKDVMNQTNSSRRPVPSSSSCVEVSRSEHQVPRAASSETEGEVANVEGLEAGLGVKGLPGTKAPFSEARTIHPAVLASMKKRGEEP